MLFGFRNFENFKTRILIALHIKKERTNLVLSFFVSFYQPITVIKEPFFLFNLEELNNRHNTLINKDKGNGVTNEETGHQWVSHHD